MMTHRLFVYGSLRSEIQHPLSRIIKRHAISLGRASCRGRLFAVDWYPGFVPDQQTSDAVIGELYEMHAPAKLLPVLDDFEGIPGHSSLQATAEYRRAILEVEWSGEMLLALVYVYNRPTQPLKRIKSGDYVEFMRSEQQTD